ncbi:MAG: pilus assembly protein TadG-related protein [Pseudomonadota bacterium]
MQRQFLQNKRGNIAMLTGLCLVPLAAIAGFSVDYARAENHKVALQNAADMAALAAGKLGNPTQAELDAVVQSVVAANFEFFNKYPGLAPTVSVSGNDLTVTANMQVDRMVLGGKFDVAVRSVVERSHGLDAPLEFSMIMDTTNSMALVSNSWGDAVSAINWTFGELVAGATIQNPANIMFMPISDRVNIGTGNADWLSGPAPTNWNGCVEPRYTELVSDDADDDDDDDDDRWGRERDDDDDDDDDDEDDDRRDRDEDDDDRDENETVRVSSKPADGFILDTVSHGDAKFEASIPGVTGGLSERNASYPRCPDAITGPTSNLTELSNAVNSAQASGTGRFDLALAWGWRLVSEDWADEFGETGFPAAAGSADKMITIVTDSHSTAYDWEAGGSNGDRDGGHAYNTLSDAAFAQIEALCQRIKDDDVEIAVLLTNSYARAKTPWENCASDDMFFEVETIGDFRVAMAAIANRYVEVRLKS